MGTGESGWASALPSEWSTRAGVLGGGVRTVRDVRPARLGLAERHPGVGVGCWGKTASPVPHDPRPMTHDPRQALRAAGVGAGSGRTPRSAASAGPVVRVPPPPSGSAAASQSSASPSFPQEAGPLSSRTVGLRYPSAPGHHGGNDGAGASRAARDAGAPDPPAPAYPWVRLWMPYRSWTAPRTAAIAASRVMSHRRKQEPGDGGQGAGGKRHERQDSGRAAGSPLP